MADWSNDCRSVKARFQDTLTLNLAGQQVQITQTLEPLATVYDAVSVMQSIVLAKLLEVRPLPLSAIELGAGLGLPSIVLGLLGCRRVVVTELPDVVPVLRANIAQICGANVEVLPLSWGVDTLAETFDLIVAADVLYDFDQYPGLVQTLLQLSHTETSILVAYKLRFPDSEAWFLDEVEPFFAVAELAARHPDYFHERVKILELRRHQ
jgi:predicted nicotinamide N-methyase